MEVRILKKGDGDEQPEAHGRFSLPEKERAQFCTRRYRFCGLFVRPDRTLSNSRYRCSDDPGADGSSRCVSAERGPRCVRRS